MKKTQLTVNFDEEKAMAIKMYLEQRNSTVESEMEKALETLYNKVVPVGVRQFLALRAQAEATQKKG